MISPFNSAWLGDNDFMLGEPSLMATGICTMSVFDKFDWDADILGSDTEELLDKICINSENEIGSLDEKSNTEFGYINPIFPDLLDDAPRNSNLKDAVCLKLISPPLSPDSLSPPSSVASPSSLYSDNECNSIMTFEDESSIKEEPVEYNIDDYESMIAVNDSCTPTAVNLTSLVPLMSEIKCERNDSSTTATTVASTSLIRSAATMKPAVIRIPVKCASAILSGNEDGRIKAIVVCPDRSKSIVCNVVRSTNKGIVIQKPINRSWLNVRSNIDNTRHESSKLPIKVNVISSKDNELLSGSLTVKNELPVEVEPEKSVASSNFNTGVSEVVESNLMSPTKIKVEWDEIGPETPQSLVGSDDEFYPFSSPSKICVKNYTETFQYDFMKSCLLDEDNLCSESYKCVPPAEVTGQMQTVIPVAFKDTLNGSPTNSGPNNSDSMLDSFYTQPDNSGRYSNHNSNNQSQFYNKAAANVHHDYGFTCRTKKFTTTSLASIFNIDSLGIQTPSASEPPTDSDDDDTLLNDVTLLNKDFDCFDLEREQKEYFENLKRQLKKAELVIDEKENHSYKSSSGISVKERKLAGRKRKLSRESCTMSPLSKLSDCAGLDAVPEGEVGSFYDTNIFANDYDTLKTPLPVKDNSSKKRKIGIGGRIFSPSERHLHNTNEQVRRIEMRQSFEELRRLIPNLIVKPRAPKVSILQEAKMVCDDLLHTDLKLQSQVTALRCQQSRLRGLLSRLRKNAACRY